MDVNQKNNVIPTWDAVEHYRQEIFNFADKIEDKRFLRRISISLKEYVKENGLE